MHCQHRSSVQCLISFSHLFSHPAFLLHFRHFSCFEFLQFFPPRHGTSRGCVLFFLISTDLLTSLDILWYYLPNCFPKWSVFCLVCLCVRACVLPLSGLSYACTFPVDTWHFQTFPTQHVSQHGISHMFCFPEFQSLSWTNLCCVWKRISQQTKWLKLG